MSNATIRGQARTPSRADRWQPWFAALVSALLHLLLLLALLYAAKPTVTTPQGAASGGRMKVDFIGETQPPEPPTQAPPSPPPPRKRPVVRPRPAASRVQSTLVQHAEDPVPPEAPTSETAVTQPEPAPRQEEAAQSQAHSPTASPPPPTPRRPQAWTGRPPGLLEEDTAPQDAGMGRSPALQRGNRHDLDAAEPSLEVGGYLVYYDLRSETQLRAWMAQGMKELFIPLPGTRHYMVCAVQIALERGSGKCRLLAPDSPELQAIGDAREVINMIQVYRQGELVWRGPGPYR